MLSNHRWGCGALLLTVELAERLEWITVRRSRLPRVDGLARSRSAGHEGLHTIGRDIAIQHIRHGDIGRQVLTEQSCRRWPGKL